MSSSPCFSIIYNFPHDDISQTQNHFITPLCKVTKRRPKKSTTPIATIDLTNTPSPVEPSPPTHDYSYHAFARDINTKQDFRRSTNQHKWTYADEAKRSLSTDTYYSIWTPKHGEANRTRSIKREGNRLSSDRKSPALEESPYTPKNQVQWRPLRGYRLQDVLHVKPVTPVNYYKKTSSLIHDSS